MPKARRGTSHVERPRPSPVFAKRGCSPKRTARQAASLTLQGRIPPRPGLKGRRAGPQPRSIAEKLQPRSQLQTAPSKRCLRCAATGHLLANLLRPTGWKRPGCFFFLSYALPPGSFLRSFGALLFRFWSLPGDGIKTPPEPAWLFPGPGALRGYKGGWVAPPSAVGSGRLRREPRALGAPRLLAS